MAPGNANKGTRTKVKPNANTVDGEKVMSNTQIAEVKFINEKL